MKGRDGKNPARVVIVGAGFTGLSAAYYLSLAGFNVTVLEKDDCVGGLAGCFDVGGEKLEKFYHHWFTSDKHIIDLITRLGLEEKLVFHSTKTGMYYARNFYKLSGPLDVLRFKPLSLQDRIRLGLLVLKARRCADWYKIESMTARQWLIKLAGKKVYEIVWKPLINGKFGQYASDVSAVYMWNKLKLRGGSRGKGSRESLAYFKGGFAALTDELVKSIREHGSKVLTNKCADGIIIEDNRVKAVNCKDEIFRADHVLLTPALPIVAGLIKNHVSAEYYNRLTRIKYLANVCLVLELEKSLTDIYWLNVNDPGFPYVGIIEHTNMEPPATYAGRHIVYLSKYLPADSPFYLMSDEQTLQFSLPHIKRMFPSFESSWIQRFHVWKEPYTQPIIESNYSRLIPDYQMPIENLWLSTMAQIYPQDRGTNYAVKAGRQVAEMIYKK